MHEGTYWQHRLAHGYLDVKPDRLWDIVVAQLPALREAVDDELGH